MRITRIRVVAGEPLDVTAAVGQPSLLVVLSPIGIASAGESGRDADVGKTAWLEPGGAVGLKALGTAGEALRFDFKTRPIGSR